VNKEITFAKIVERTCKRDAYLQVSYWSKSKGTEYGSPYWYAREKAKGHQEFLMEVGFEYDYLTQSLKPVDLQYHNGKPLKPQEKGGADE
jgi:hypothetical protein